MKKWATVLAAAILAIPFATHAQLPPSLTIEFDFEGMGNAVMNSPVVYSGTVTNGDPLVVGAEWSVNINDSGWPDPGNPQARWDYIFNNYFVYEGAPVNSWTAVFDETNLPSKPTWQVIHPTNGMMGGTLIVVVTYSDWDCDGMLDVEERMMAVYSGTLVIMKYGTGLFAGYCGEGAFNGGLMNPDPGNWADDFVEGHALLYLEDCRIGTEEMSWSAIKKLFE